MSQGQITVASATAAVFVDGRQKGSAVLVDTRHLVTAAHVLRRYDPDTLDKAPVSQVELEFPARTATGKAGRVTASRVDLGRANHVDVAVLDLGENPPGWLPAPVALWPAARMPPTVRVFGYPLTERRRAKRPLNGVWRTFTVAGPTAGGLVQLDWVGGGTFRGHSGGPVIDPDGHALAGILVHGSERGWFDRFLPVTLIARVWPELPRPWAFVGNDARSHARQRSRGWPRGVHGGDLFHGRAAALEAINSWFTAAEAPQLPLVVTGQPGAGKSAVLARAALAAEARQDRDGLFFHAQGATVQGFWAALCEFVGLAEQADVEALGKRLETREQPLLVAVDALDEAVSEEERTGITQLIKEVAGLPAVRMVVATRKLTAGDPYRWDRPLGRLGATDPAARNVVDLDDDRFFHQAELGVYAAALLARHGVAPAPSGLAWERYRADEALRPVGGTDRRPRRTQLSGRGAGSARPVRIRPFKGA